MRNIHEIDIQKIEQFIHETEDLTLLRQKLNEFHEYNLAIIFKSLSEYDLLKVYSIFTDEEIGEILSYVDSDDAAEIIEDLNEDKIASIINTMEPDDAADIIQEFKEDKQAAIIGLLDEEQKEDVEELVSYDEDTAGAIMNTNFISILSGSDVKDIMKEIVHRAPDVQSITTSFVVDENDRLLGTLDLKKIIKTKSPTKVDDIMNTNVITIETDDTLEHAFNYIKKYDIYDLPVLENGVLKGIISMDDALDAFHEESEDDYIKFAAVGETLELDEKIILSVKSRLPWLVLLLFLNLIIALVTSNFDYLFAIDALTILVVFQPIILGLAGNCGTQSLAVTISEIAKDNLDTKAKIIKHISKEFLLGICTGLILGIISIGIAFVVLQFSSSTLKITDVMITVSTSLTVSIIVANLFASIIPIIFYKIKIDPAAASGPLITTIIDVIAVVIYYTLATLIIYNFIN
jgi:magnesium transporter